MFSWRINEKEGCFELGTPSSSDDLYILNVTIISASYLHLLWNGRSPKKTSGDEYIWQVKYKAYGCEIKSDPFILSLEDAASRRTFIGDKATARIRSHPAVFCDYLQQDAVEFHVIRFQLSPNNELINEEVMGVSFVELADLAKSDVKELKATLEIVSEWGYPRVAMQSEKPEVRVVFQLEAMPAFFHNENETSVVNAEIAEGTEKIIQDFNELKISEESSEKLKVQVEEIDTAMPAVSNHIAETESSLNKDEILEIPTGVSEKNFVHENKTTSAEEQTKYHLNSESSSPSSSSNTEFGHNKLQTVSSPEKENSFDGDLSSSSSSNSENSNKNLNVPIPGTYEITIGLSKFWLKSNLPMLDDVVLSYIHPKFGIVDDAIISTAKPSSEKHRKKPYYQCMAVKDGITTTKVAFLKFSEKIINEPLTVEFRKFTQKFMGPIFAFSMIPVGYVMLQQETNGTRTLKGFSEILKSGTNIKIGVLHYFVKVTGEEPLPLQVRHNNAGRSDEINSSPLNKRGGENKVLDSAIVFKTVESLNVWKAEQKHFYVEELKQKERAYLQILAEEAAERDKQRENIMSEKLIDIKKKQKELNKQMLRLTDKEEKLKSLEMELAASSQKTSLDNTSKLENAKIRIHRMEEEHKIEISSLKRRNEEYKAELEKCKGKLAVIERKLEEKEEYICKLKTEKHDTLNSHFPEKLKLENENKLLKKQVIETERSRDQYKKQSQTLCHKLARLQEERDKQLKDENENLRLQILASKEHKELKKERKAVVDASQTIRTLQDNAKSKDRDSVKEPPRSENVVKDSHQRRRKSDSKSSKEDEIIRLTQMRNGLLTTGAYTQYDLVIKEMERRIVGLAESGNKNQ